MRRYAGVIARYDGRVALVREQYDTWDAPYWNLPSGSVETGESATAGAIRELREETGLRADEGALELAWTTEVAVDGLTVSRSWNYVVRVSDADFAVDDPDGSVMDVRWFSPADAVRRLRELPYPPLGVPAAGFLADDVRGDWAFSLSGAMWSWELPKVQG